MILADCIRKHVLSTKIAPTRLEGKRFVIIRAGEIHRELSLENWMPAVCGALDADKFLAFARVKLIDRPGPKHGSSAKWVFALE